MTSNVVSGDLSGKQSQLAALLQEWIDDPDDLQPWAPEFAGLMDVVDESNRGAYAIAAHPALEFKDLRPTREEVSLLMGFCSTPYDGVETVAHL